MLYQVDVMALADGPLRAGTTIDGGRYRLVRVIGDGGFSHVYLGLDTRLRRDVVVKEFFPIGMGRARDGQLVVQGWNWEGETYADWLEAFVQEGIYLARIVHSSIVKVFDIVEENNTAYLVLEKVAGETLEDLHFSGRVSEEQLERWMSRVVDALAVVHKLDILHLDLKPGNILITFSGSPMVMDFGSARRRGSRPEGIAFTRGYASPELVDRDKGTLGPAADIYSLGATIHELLARSIPRPGAVVEERIPSRWIPLLETALDPDPAHRGTDVRLWWSLLGQGRDHKRYLVPRESPRYYHTLAGCPYIRGRATLRRKKVEGLEPCRLCGSPHLRAPEDAFFITPDGRFYHRSRGCYRLNWSPKIAEISYSVGDLKPCGFCVPAHERYEEPELADTVADPNEIEIE